MTDQPNLQDDIDDLLEADLIDVLGLVSAILIWLEDHIDKTAGLEIGANASRISDALRILGDDKEGQ